MKYLAKLVIGLAVLFALYLNVWYLVVDTYTVHTFRSSDVPVVKKVITKAQARLYVTDRKVVKSNVHRSGNKH